MAGSIGARRTYQRLKHSSGIARQAFRIAQQANAAEIKACLHVWLQAELAAIVRPCSSASDPRRRKRC